MKVDVKDSIPWQPEHSKADTLLFSGMHADWRGRVYYYDTDYILYTKLYSPCAGIRKSWIQKPKVKGDESKACPDTWRALIMSIQKQAQEKSLENWLSAKAQVQRRTLVREWGETPHKSKKLH